MRKLLNWIRRTIKKIIRMITRKDLVDYIIAFNEKGGKDNVRSFLQEYVDGRYMILKDITEDDIVDQDNKPVAKALVAHVTTTQKTRKILERDFGKYLYFDKEEMAK